MKVLYYIIDDKLTNGEEALEINLFRYMVCSLIGKFIIDGKLKKH